ncbi:MAG: hypothetical protein HKN49_13125 [Gammaproteobacteria bacterium]|nr:hypothetical protein [Gammaproteobacteria bacterium]
MSSAPTFIAHRGEASRYPENTVVALQGAIDGGIRHLEFDVQLSADRVPVLSHDAVLTRTAGLERIVSAGLAAELTDIGVGEVSRFGDTFQSQRLPSLQRVLQALESAPPLHLFVELKRHSLRAFGRQRVIEAALPLLRTSPHKITVISFDYDVLELLQSIDGLGTGWVLSAYDDAAKVRLQALSPDFVFCNQVRLPPRGLLWQGSWHWAIYEIASISEVHTLLERGASHFESMRAAELKRQWHDQV